METTDVLILGAGAAGLMCALMAGRRGRRVTVLDHARQSGEKILISGGGRCNFTNLDCGPEKFFSDNPDFCRSALALFGPMEFLSLVEKHHIAWHEKTKGQLFCDGSARQIVDMLEAECCAVGVRILLQERITYVSRSDKFQVSTETRTIHSSSLVLATGGLSIPKLGATGLAHSLARQFGLPMITPRPALVPLLLNPTDLARTKSLAGVSALVAVQCSGSLFRDGMVFTHRGLSGPAILQISSVWREGQPLTLNLVPTSESGFLRDYKRARPRARLRGILGEMLPQRLTDIFLPTALTIAPLGEVSDRCLSTLEARIRSWQIMPDGTEGYAKAEVTLGGVSTKALQQKDMSVSNVPGLFVIGEAVDVTGWLGGVQLSMGMVERLGCRPLCIVVPTGGLPIIQMSNRR